MNFLEILKIGVQLIPVVTEAIKAIEAAIPGEGKGEQKLAAVRVMLESAYAAAGGVVGQFEAIWKMVNPLITVLVPILTKLKK